MPNTGNQKNDEQIDKRSVFSFSVSSQRDIDVFAKPGSQRNVPPTPEFSNRLGEIRKAEVFL